MLATNVQSVGGSAPRLRHLVLQAGAWVAAGFVLDKVLALAQMMVLARLLMPADFGLMAMSSAVVLVLFTLTELGLDPALVARREVQDDDLAVAWTLSCLRATALAAGLWLTAGLIAQAMQAPALAPVLRIHAVAAVLQGIQSPGLALLLRRLDFAQRVRMDLLRRAVEMTVTIGLAWRYQTVWALVGGLLAGCTFSCLWSYGVAPFRPRFAWAGPSLRYFVQFGKCVNVTTVLTVCILSGGEFLIGRTLGAESLGLYQIAMAIPLLIGVRATVMLGQVSLPTYARLQTDRQAAVKAFLVQMKLVGLLLLPAAACLAVFAPVIVPLVFGSRWSDAVEPVRILSLYAVCAGLTGTMTAVQYGMNRADLPLRAAVVQCALYAVVIMPLLARFGLAGAAGALALAYLASVLVSAKSAVDLIGEAARPALVSLAWIALISAALGAGLMQLLPSHVVGVAPLALAGAGIVSLYAWYLWRVEYPRLLSLWRREVW